MSTSEPIDFAAIIEPVARHLLGEPNHKLSNGKQLRFGSQGSVAVEIGGDKKGTWYDHERGKGGGTLDLIGVQKNLIIPDAIRWLEEHSFIPKREKEPTPPKFNIVKRYDYKDANGTLLFRVARLDPKDFRQQAPDGTWKTAHIKKVPYRLPELLAAPLTTNVYIPEGEKDVDALRQQLLVATCNPGGAGKWRQEYNAHFAGRPVIVLSDNDPQAVDTDGKPRFHPDGRPVFPGQDHAAEIANNLKGIAASVRVLMLPNLPPKGDVSDWLAAGGSAEELERLASEALVLEPEPETEPPPTVIDGNWWLGRDLPLPVAVLGEVICASTRMLLSGPTGIGKTHLAMAIAGSISVGRGFLHWFGPPTPMIVLYVDGEMARDLMQDRIRDLHRRMGKPDFANLHVLCREDFPGMQGLNTEEGRQFLLDTVERIHPAIVFLDNRMSLTVGDMKEEMTWTDTMPLVMELTRRQIAQIWIDHTGYDGSHAYGTSTKEWQMDVIVLLEAGPEQPDTDISIKLKFTKARRRRQETREDFAAGTITLCKDEWTWLPTEPGSVAAGKRGRKISDETDELRKAILNLSSDKSVTPIVVQDGMKPVRAVGVVTTIAYLITNGWFTEMVDYTVCNDNGTNTLTRKGRDRLRNSLITLKNQGICGSDKDWVWPV